MLAWVSRIAFDFEAGALSPEPTSDCLSNCRIWFWRRDFRIRPLDTCWRWLELAGRRDPYPERAWQWETHTETQKCGCQGGFEPCWCFYSCSPGVQAIISTIIIHPSWRRYDSPKERGYTSERFKEHRETTLTHRDPRRPKSHTNTPLHEALNKAAASVKRTEIQRLSRLVNPQHSHPGSTIYTVYIHTHAHSVYTLSAFTPMTNTTLIQVTCFQLQDRKKHEHMLVLCFKNGLYFRTWLKC